MNISGGTIKTAASASDKTYGGIDIWGDKGGYTGASFFDSAGSYKGTFMIRSSDYLSGFFVEDVGWKWYWDGSGILTAGTVPPGRISPQGSGSLLDADTVDTYHATSFFPGGWTCTVRSAAAAGGEQVTASCIGSEKVITGGCTTNDGSSHWLVNQPSAQGWTCDGSLGIATAYANCCS